jgi:hypothetical protein
MVSPYLSGADSAEQASAVGETNLPGSVNFCDATAAVLVPEKSRSMPTEPDKAAA